MYYEIKERSGTTSYCTEYCAAQYFLQQANNNRPLWMKLLGIRCKIVERDGAIPRAC